MRRHWKRRSFKQKRQAVVLLQAYTRGLLARRAAQKTMNDVSAESLEMRNTVQWWMSGKRSILNNINMSLLTNSSQDISHLGREEQEQIALVFQRGLDGLTTQSTKESEPESEPQSEPEPLSEHEESSFDLQPAVEQQAEPDFMVRWCFYCLICYWFNDCPTFYLIFW